MNEHLTKDTTALAFLGDAVYEVYIREKLVLGHIKGADRLHRAAVKYVKAEAQCQIMKSILEDLTEEELALVKRARNRKIINKPKNTDPIEYKWATALEALIGYLYLKEKKERVMELIDMALERMDEKNEKKEDKKI